MNTTLLRNDIVHFRLWLAGWAGLLALPTALVALLRTSWGWDPRMWTWLAMAVPILLLLQLVFAALLVFQLFQKESPANARGYWRTRPFRARDILLAKGIFILGLLIVPAAVCAWLQAWMVDATSFDAVVVTVASTALCAALAGLAGVFLRTLPQALLAGIALIVATGLGGATARKSARWLADATYAIVPPGFPSLPIFAMIAATSVAAILLARYRSPHRWIGPAFGAALLFLGGWVAAILPRPPAIPTSTIAPPDGSFLELSSFSYTRAQYAGVSQSFSIGSKRALWSEAGPGGRIGLSSHIQWRDLPADWVARSRVLFSRTAGGKALPPGEPRFSASVTGTLPADTLRLLFPDAEPAAEPEARHPSAAREVSFFSVSRSLLHPAPLEVVAEIETHFSRPIRHDYPLEVGRTFSVGKNRYHIAAVRNSSRESLEVEIGFLAGGSSGEWFHPTLFPVRWVLLDTHGKRVFPASIGASRMGGGSWLIWTGRFTLSFEKVGAVDPADLVLALVEYQPRGNYHSAVPISIPDNAELGETGLVVKSDP